MGTLTITKSYAASTALMEVDIDAFRNGLHTLFNTDKLGSTNFSGAMALTSTKFTGTSILSTDNTNITFGATSDATFGLDASKNFVWNTSTTTFELRFYAGSTYYMEVATDKVNMPGDIIIGAGGSGQSVLQALSSYRKPVLEWSSSTAVTLQNNSATTDQTVIYFPTFIAAVTEAAPSKFRFASISVEANGYGTAHTGAAKGGRKVGLALTTNTWYYVYAAKVRSGTDFSSSTAKFVIVFDNVAPLAANGATLDTSYGNGNWVYLGLVRYGFGAAGTGAAIPRFKYSNKGWCSFYETDPAYAGINLAYTTTDADDTTTAFYTFAAGISGQVLPETIGHVRLQLARARVSDWKIRETSTSTSDVIWAGGWQTDDGTLGHGFLVEVPNVTGYSVFQERKSSNAGTTRAVTLAGFCDGYMLQRRHGHGV